MTPRVWRCRLYPEPGTSRLYVRALVFARRYDLLAFWKRCGCSQWGRAQCQDTPTYYGKSRHRTPVVATLSFWAGELDVRVTAHECAHAAFSWAQRRGISLAVLDFERFAVAKLDPIMAADHPEERVVTVIGDLTAQLVRRASASGLYP